MRAKLIEHKDGQIVLLPKALEFEGNEVEIEKRGDEVILKPLKPIKKRRFASLNDVAKYMRENYPEGADFPDIERPGPKQTREINLD